MKKFVDKILIFLIKTIYKIISMNFLVSLNRKIQNNNIII